MGMFDYINYEAPCPKCGRVLKDWQSKNGPCGLNKLEPYEVDNFHSLCMDCKAWTEVWVERDLTIIVNKVVLHKTLSDTYSGHTSTLESEDLTDRYRGERGRIINSGP